MATYSELSTIRNDPLWNSLLLKIQVACAIKAAEVIDSTTPAATLLDWAKQAVASPNKAGQDVAYYVIASNASATVTQIYNATDAAIQTNVDAAVDAIYGG